MEIHKARYLVSAERYDQCPAHDMAEVCFIGRSNVGKSSLINALTNHPRLAKTSATPGKTRLLNFFTINDGQWCLVDLPGYGYAKVSQEKRGEWTRTMETYLLKRPNLALIVLLADSRHEPLDSDMEMAFWLAENQRPFALALTKADKLSRNAAQRVRAKFLKELDEMNIEVPVVLTSVQTREGLEELRDLIASFATDANEASQNENVSS